MTSNSAIAAILLFSFEDFSSVRTTVVHKCSAHAQILDCWCAHPSIQGLLHYISYHTNHARHLRAANFQTMFFSTTTTTNTIWDDNNG